MSELSDAMVGRPEASVGGPIGKEEAENTGGGWGPSEATDWESKGGGEASAGARGNVDRGSGRGSAVSAAIVGAVANAPGGPLGWVLGLSVPAATAA